MFAVGHLALGYLSGKAASKILRIDVNLPLLFLLSLFPDMDLVILRAMHRGPTHSIIITTLLFFPFFMACKKKATPYFAAVASHILIGDFIETGGVKLFWPLSQTWYSLNLFPMYSSTGVLSEWIPFGISAIIMLKSEDLNHLLRPHFSNLSLILPAIGVLTSFFLPSQSPMLVLLSIPNLVYLAVFASSIAIEVKEVMRRD